MYSDCKNNKIAFFFDDTLSVKSANKKGEKFKKFSHFLLFEYLDRKF